MIKIHLHRYLLGCSAKFCQTIFDHAEQFQSNVKDRANRTLYFTPWPASQPPLSRLCTNHRGHHTATFAPCAIAAITATFEPGSIATRSNDALYDQDTATFAPGTVAAFEQGTIATTQLPLQQVK